MNYKYMVIGIAILVLIISSFYIINTKGTTTGNIIKNSESLEIKGNKRLRHFITSSFKFSRILL
ncbi:hypothetical protein J4205_04490 [Candidatus Pacearchaeota archaeon]|nr:hypothetical protein [Candidatus Pacearchaeota archaeon]